MQSEMRNNLSVTSGRFISLPHQYNNKFTLLHGVNLMMNATITSVCNPDGVTHGIPHQSRTETSLFEI